MTKKTKTLFFVEDITNDTYHKFDEKEYKEWLNQSRNFEEDDFGDIKIFKVEVVEERVVDLVYVDKIIKKY